ncbi:MAG: hypothetical protein AABW63_02310 [Nanoarchaeota archaeon]
MASQTITSNSRTLEQMSLDHGIKTIEIDGATLHGGDRYLVKINGQKVYLTGKSFAYFTKLAWFRKHGEGWVDNDALEPGFNQARYLYRMKTEIREGLRKGEEKETRPLEWGVAENRRDGRYRMIANPGVITFNEANLKRYPDHTVSSLVTR